MNEVSCQVTRALLDAARVEGFSSEQLFHGRRFSLERLSDPKSRVDWDTFATLCDRLEAICQSPEQAARIGAGLLTAPPHDVVRRLAGLLADARDVYDLAARWIVPLAFLHMQTTLCREPDGRLLLAMEFPSCFRSGRSFFRICRGAMAATPTLLGLPWAPVEAHIEDHRATYTITPPPPMPLLERARRGSRALLGLRALTEEMARMRAELQEAHVALLRSKQDLQGVLESIPDLVLIHRDGLVVWANQAAARCFGAEQVDELVGQSGLDFVHPDDRERMLARSHRPIDSPALAAHDELRFLRRDGEIVTIEAAPAREILFEGAPARLVVARDVSERRRMQEQLLVTERMASLGTLAAGVAHEINNPLAYMALNLEVAARELSQINDRRLTKAENSITDAIEGSSRVRAIVGDLKMFARTRNDPSPVDVREIVDSAAALAASDLRRRAHLTRVYGSTQLVLGNKSRLGQVFLNLLLNAIDAIEEGDPEHNEIRIRTSMDGARKVIIEVSDTGSGIPEATLPRIFEPFFTTKPPGRGTGLGLAICRHIVSELGGELTARSIEGEGSTFRVVLPAAVESHAPTLGDANACEPSLRVAPATPLLSIARPRLLIVDDEPALVRSLDTALSDYYDVTTATSSRVALEIAREGYSFDAILCDLMMTGMTGMDLVEALTSIRPELCNRFVFMTGGAYTAESRRFLALTAHRCLLKPFSIREALEALASVTARRQPGRVQANDIDERTASEESA
ncbi:hybrid sensor histidine kinase/response regulator [Chondromyces crocatus]|uniref:histidine kinase n=1 Tax=Chondromyces crocatus TaxID=52 RepID=A0A0K1E741_CHOCO|nr:ATP-binding protein [Chondromyces crocatus]AKT36507.1 uncharacterized protein CMC5_006230 [Chondromyces crocatus]